MSRHPLSLRQGRHTPVEEPRDESLYVLPWEDLLRFGDGHMMEGGGENCEVEGEPVPVDLNLSGRTCAAGRRKEEGRVRSGSRRWFFSSLATSEIRNASSPSSQKISHSAASVAGLSNKMRRTKS